MPIFGNEIFDSNGTTTAVADYVSRLEKIYKKKKEINGEQKPIVLKDNGSNEFENTPNGTTLNSITFAGEFTQKALNYSDNFEKSMRRGINKGNATDVTSYPIMSDVDGKTILSEYQKIYIGALTSANNLKQNRWWYVGNSENSSTYLQSVPIANSNKPTLFIRNISTQRSRTEQYPISQQPNLNQTLQQIYETFDFGPNEYNDSLSPYQITHNEFGNKTYWGTLRNTNSDDRKYENRVVQKNILLTQANRLLEGASGMLGGAIPISLNNLDTTGAGIQSTILFAESTLAGMANGMGMIGSVAGNAIARLFGFPTKASYGMLRPSDSVLHNKYTIDGKGINTGIFNKTPFGIGEITQDLLSGNFGDLPDTFGVDLPIFGSFNKVKSDPYPLSLNMTGYYSVLSYSQIKQLQVDTSFNRKTWIDFRDYISDGKAYHTPGKKGKPALKTIRWEIDPFERNILNSKEFTFEDELQSKKTDAYLMSDNYTDESEDAIIDYENFNPEKKFGFSRAGAVGMYKKDFTRMQESLEYNMYDTFTMHPIEIVENPADIKPYIEVGNQKIRDYIKFHIYDVVNKELIRLRATITDVAESVSPNWEASEYVGKADPIFTYKGAQRKFTFSFTLYSNTRAEFLPMWQKINKLYGLMYPTYQDDILYDKTGKAITGRNYISGSDDLTYEQSLIISKKYGSTETEINKLVSASKVSGSAPLDLTKVSGYGEYTKSINEMKKRNIQERAISYFMNKGRPIAPFIMLTLGDWFVNEPGYLTELSVQVDNNYPWEINLENDFENIAQLPHLIRISTGFQPIGKDLYENGANFFGWQRIGTKMHAYQDPNFVGLVETTAQTQQDNSTQTDLDAANNQENNQPNEQPNEQTQNTTPTEQNPDSQNANTNDGGRKKKKRRRKYDYSKPIGPEPPGWVKFKGTYSTLPSKREYKKNIKYVETIKGIKFYNFEYNDNKYGVGIQYGVMLDEIEKILPAAIKGDKVDYNIIYEYIK